MLWCKKHDMTHTHTQPIHFTALCTLSGTTRVSGYQKVHFAIFWIFWCKMKITQADAPTIWMDLIQTNWCRHLCHPHHFYAGYPSWHNPPNLSWLGTGTKYAGLHTWWLGNITPARTHTHTRLTAYFSCTTWQAGTRKVNDCGFYWSKRWWGVANHLHHNPNR